MGITLYELTKAGERIRDLMASEDAEDWQQALDDIEADITAKIVGCGMVYRNLMAEVSVYKAEAERLGDKASKLERKAERLREYVEMNAKSAGIREVKEGTLTGKWRKLPDVVEVDDADKVPCVWCRFIPSEWKPDKGAIKDQLKLGHEILGAHLVTGREKWGFND